MSIEIFMPALSPTMEVGTLSKWLVKEGDTVENGDVIAEIETDKATMEVESIDDGVVAKILVAEGTEDVPVGQIIAVLAEEDEDVADITMPTAPKPVAKPDAAPTEAVQTVPVAAPATAEPAAVSAPAVSAPVSADTSERVKASPLARRLAIQKGLDLATVSGTGPYGRIVKRDVETAQVGAPVAATQAAAPAVSAPTYGAHDIPFREERLSGMRKVIAKRLTESKQTVPHFYL
ncbi:MAG: E3 binding domain-containing protein, partial [Kordiimonadaceae bacterium]|nr:E3 binding domain-containing protein [Kordiimonadaceae bacterium]